MTTATRPAASTLQPPLLPAQGLSATGVSAVVLSLIGWTTIPLFLHFFARDIDAWTSNGWRYAISAVIWAPAIMLATRRGTMPPGLWKAALVPAFWNAAAQVCFALAPYFIQPGLMIFSMRLQIVFLALSAALMFPAERRVLKSPAFLAALFLVLIATLATVALKPAGAESPDTPPLAGQPHAYLIGVTLAIAAGLMYALYALGVRKHMVGMNPILAFAAVSQYTAAALVLCMLVFARDNGAEAVTHLTPFKFGLLVASSLIGIGLGHTFYFYAIARLGLVVAAGVIQLQPITVSIASMFLFNEAMTGWQWTTGLVAVAGAIGMLVVQHRILRRTS
jgi:drug/metabolite transporter (DMT)-like permease